MSLWRQWKHGLRVLAHRQAADRDLEDEITQYLDEVTASLQAKGIAPDEARWAARVEIGSALAVREQVRESNWETRVEDLWNDCRHAARRLARNPGFATTVLLTLALGVGAATAIFTVLDHVLLQPLPYPHSERLVALAHTAPGINVPYLRMSPSLYYTYREESRVFERIALWNGNRSTVTGLGEAEEVPTLFVTHDFLNVLQVQPAIGRGFTPADDDPNGVRTVLLADGYWKRRFGGDLSVLGKTILINGNPNEIIGVLPASFEFMDEKISLIVPMRPNRSTVRLISFAMDGIGRLKPGVTIEQANADVARCLLMAPAKFPMNQGFAATAFTAARISPTLRSLKNHLVGDIGKTLWTLMGAVGILLLIACANVANLMLLRADARQRELALRVALGAGWGRIAREVLAESLVLGVAGGAIGLMLCLTALRVLSTSGVNHVPRLNEVSLDFRTLAFAAIISVGAALSFGLITVWKHAHTRILDSVRNGGSRTVSENREQWGARSPLVVVQVALAMVLLISSGLMIRTYRSLRSVDPGFSKPEQVQAVRVSIPETQAKEQAQVLALQETILRKFEAIPGVSSVSITTSAPLEGGSGNPVYAADHEYAAGAIAPARQMRDVSPGFPASIGSHLVAGRDFTWSELHNPAALALVSENFARELWGSPQAAIGKRIRISLNQEWRQVIGVMANLRDDGIHREPPAIVYWLLTARDNDGNVVTYRNVDFLIRSPRAGSATFIQELQQALASVNPNLPLANVRTLEAIYRKSLGRTSFALVLLAVAGSMALILGVVGISGVVAYSVSRRTREIGIRIALGSQVRGVVQMFVREGLLLSCIGAACGLMAAFAVTRLMESLLFGVSPVDLLTYGVVSLGLIAATLIASWLPARRVAGVDPVNALRAE
jgi:predicted permease